MREGIALRHLSWAAVALGVGCSSSPTFILTLTASPATIDEQGQPSVLGAQVSTAAGNPGNGTVSLTAPAGSFVGGGRQATLNLDADGFAAVSFVCLAALDAGCPASVNIAATWKNQIASAVITVSQGASDAGADAGPSQCPTGSACRLTDGGVGSCCGTCVDTSSDGQNCSACGLACPLGGACSDGSCLFPDGGYVGCLGPAGCPLVACAPCPSGSVCVLGRTQLYCTTTLCAGLGDGALCAVDGFTPGICCQGSCINPQEDPNNCSACGHGCGGGNFCALGSCATNPDCGVAVPGTSCLLPSNAVGACCEGACVDTQGGSTHCGTCRVGCPSGASCASGFCVVPDGGLANCTAPGACGPGTYCQRGGCLSAGCSPSTEREPCAFGEIRTAYGSSGLEFFGEGTCCQQTCVDVTQDPGNCGACGAVCPSGSCEAGIFTPPECWPADAGPDGGVCGAASSPNCSTADGGTGICCDQCRDPLNDPLACGGCAIACPAGQTCNSGACSGAVSPCGNGRVYAFCGAGGLCCPGGGCTSLWADPANCGACANVCDAGQSCDAGACS
jgi:hypothetical protein